MAYATLHNIQRAKGELEILLAHPLLAESEELRNDVMAAIAPARDILDEVEQLMQSAVPMVSLETLVDPSLSKPF